MQEQLEGVFWSTALTSTLLLTAHSGYDTGLQDLQFSQEGCPFALKQRIAKSSLAYPRVRRCAYNFLL